eukprot:Partr_v1_DN28689_c4_g1_i2_m50512 putative nudix (nucleoside diphosphate linked moiety X)-type motif
MIRLRFLNSHKYIMSCTKFIANRSKSHGPSNLPLEPLPEGILRSMAGILDFSQTSFQNRLRLSLQTQPSRLGRFEKYDPPRNASILVPLCMLETSQDVFEPAILFTVRSLKLRNHPGEVSFPGGLVDSELDYRDNSRYTPSELAAIRETIEEIPSIKVDRIVLMGPLESVPDKTRTIKVTPYVAYIGEVRMKSNSRGQPEYGIVFGADEVSAVFPMTIRELFDKSRMGSQTFRDSGIQFPFWKGPVYQGPIFDKNTSTNFVSGDDNCLHYRIWGLSAWVLAEFLRDHIRPMFIEMSRGE